MENYTPLMQRLITALDQPLTNNSYVWSLKEDINPNFKGSILQEVVDTNGIPVINNDLIQSIAAFNSVEESVNGSWLQALVEKLEE